MNWKAFRITLKHAAMALALAAFLLPIADALAANGFSVTVRWRYDCSGWTSTFPESMDMEGCSGIERGTLVRFEIQNNQVVKTDTVIPMTTALCQYPAISLDGKRIAFFRWGCVVGKDASGKDALLNQNLPGKVSVVDIDGRNLRDLVNLPVAPSFDAALDWAADGWIYYIKPRAGSNFTFRNGYEVWKVNPNAANPASTDQLVFADPACGYMRRFSMSQDATRMAQQTYPLPGTDCATCPYVCSTTLAQCFPPKAINDCVITSIGSCNAKISPSGNFGGGFCGGWHDYTEIRSLSGSHAALVTCVQGSRCNVPTASQWAGFNLAGGTGGVEQLCWSTNSDKWICEDVMYNNNYKRGKLQYIINWIDKQAIVTTRTPDNPPGPTGDPVRGTVSHLAFTGDFWVRPPAGFDYAYEDTSGNWHQLPRPVTMIQPGFSPSPISGAGLKTRTDACGITHIALPGEMRYRVSVIDMQGKTAIAGFAQTEIRLMPGTLKAGIYLVLAKTHGAVHTSMLSIGR
jgi:hypothetical protein